MDQPNMMGQSGMMSQPNMMAQPGMMAQTMQQNMGMMGNMPNMGMQQQVSGCTDVCENNSACICSWLESNALIRKSFCI